MEIENSAEHIIQRHYLLTSDKEKEAAALLVERAINLTVVG